MYHELRLHQQQFAALVEELQRLRTVAEQADLRSLHLAEELATLHHKPAESGIRNFRPRAPSPFGGGPKELTTVRAWLFNTASYLDSCTFPTEASRMSIIPTLLCGDASVWWMYLSLGETSERIPETWVEFSAALLHQFEPVNARENARGLFLVLRQTASVQDYIAEWRSLAMQLTDISEEDKRFRFIYGLQDHLQIAINSQAISSLSDTIANAERLDHYHRLRKNSATSIGKALQRLSHPSTSVTTAYTARAAQPMELGSLEQWDDYSFDERSHFLEEDEAEQIAAIMSRPRPLLARTGKAPFGPGNSLSTAQRVRALENNLCFRCLSSDHAARDCKLPTPKGGQSSA